MNWDDLAWQKSDIFKLSGTKMSASQDTKHDIMSGIALLEVIK